MSCRTVIHSCILAGCTFVMFVLYYQNIDKVHESPAMISTDPDVDDRMWLASSAVAHSNSMLAENPASVKGTVPTWKPAASSVVDKRITGDDENWAERSQDPNIQNSAETFIDKHVYPPWPTESARARNREIEDKITDGELATRLSRAIDRHEKCRRHWPHLERLEAAQEIRVRDARNNLEVANRGIERARKELIDAENLVMSARQEHQIYEKKRSDFAVVRQQYVKSHSYLSQNRAAMHQIALRRSAELAALHDKGRKLTSLHSEEVRLVTQESRLKQRAQDDEIELAAREPQHPVLLQQSHSPAQLRIVHGQELAQLPSDMTIPLKVAVSTQVSKKSTPAEQAAASPRRVPIDQAIGRLKQRERQLAARETQFFAQLPQQERRQRALQHEVAQGREEAAALLARVAAGKSRVWEDRDHGAPAESVQLDRRRLRLASLDALIGARTLRRREGELSAVRSAEQRGPAAARQLGLLRRRVAALALRRRDAAALRAAGVPLPPPEARVASARETQLVQLPAAEAAEAEAATLQPAADPGQDLRAVRDRLRQVDSRLMGVRSRLASRRQEVRAGEQRLRSRTHELARATRLAEGAGDGGGADVQRLGEEYESELRGVREERRKADGLLAKAERMLNVARIDTRNSARSKKAALEELSYATHKLRKYQDLRAKSQRCQMEAWSEIRHLTHNARGGHMMIP